MTEQEFNTRGTVIEFHRECWGFAPFVLSSSLSAAQVHNPTEMALLVSLKTSFSQSGGHFPVLVLLRLPNITHDYHSLLKTIFSGA
jgi:hypothetical protein